MVLLNLQRLAFFALVVLVIPTLFNIALAQEEKDPKLRPRQGFQFDLPADWPVEEHEGGVLRPAPVEEYLALKFGKTDERFDTLERDMLSRFIAFHSLQKDLQEKVSDIDERLKDLEQWLKYGEARRLD